MDSHHRGNEARHRHHHPSWERDCGFDDDDDVDAERRSDDDDDDFVVDDDESDDYDYYDDDWGRYEQKPGRPKRPSLLEMSEKRRKRWLSVERRRPRLRSQTREYLGIDCYSPMEMSRRRLKRG